MGMSEVLVGVPPSNVKVEGMKPEVSNFDSAISGERSSNQPALGNSPAHRKSTSRRLYSLFGAVSCGTSLSCMSP